MSPKEGYLAPFIQFPWGFETSLIGKEIDVYDIGSGFLIQYGSITKNFDKRNTPKLNPKIETEPAYKSAALPAKPLGRHTL